MSNQSQFQNVFEELKKIISDYASKLTCVRDEPGNYYLETKHTLKNKKAMFFGAVQIRKAYVSYHLMPVYVFPELLQNISPKLKRRMQGKSCFNFKLPGDELFEELAQLTETSYERYKEEGYV